MHFFISTHLQVNLSILYLQLIVINHSPWLFSPTNTHQAIWNLHHDISEGLLFLPNVVFFFSISHSMSQYISFFSTLSSLIVSLYIWPVKSPKPSETKTIMALHCSSCCSGNCLIDPLTSFQVPIQCLPFIMKYPAFVIRDGADPRNQWAPVLHTG